MGIVLLVALGSVGQFGYGGYGGYGVPGFGYGYGYPNALGYAHGYGYGIPRPYYDPIGYYRFYNGAGYYARRPTPVYPPRTISVRPWIMEWPGVTGRVVGLDEHAKTITLRLPAETVSVRYGAGTRFRALDDTFPEIRPGVLINVDRSTITVLSRGDG